MTHLLLALGLFLAAPYAPALRDLDAPAYATRVAARQALKREMAGSRRAVAAVWFHSRTTESVEAADKTDALLDPVYAAAESRYYALFSGQSEATWDEVAEALIDAPHERDGLPWASAWQTDMSYRAYYALSRVAKKRGLTRPIDDCKEPDDFGLFNSFEVVSLDRLRFRSRGIPAMAEYEDCWRGLLPPSMRPPVTPLMVRYQLGKFAAALAQK